jgi:hypothetical protein
LTPFDTNITTSGHSQHTHTADITTNWSQTMNSSAKRKLQLLKKQKDSQLSGESDTGGADTRRPVDTSASDDTSDGQPVRRLQPNTSYILKTRSGSERHLDSRSPPAWLSRPPEHYAWEPPPRRQPQRQPQRLPQRRVHQRYPQMYPQRHQYYNYGPTRVVPFSESRERQRIHDESRRRRAITFGPKPMSRPTYVSQRTATESRGSAGVDSESSDEVVVISSTDSSTDNLRADDNSDAIGGQCRAPKVDPVFGVRRHRRTVVRTRNKITIWFKTNDSSDESSDGSEAYQTCEESEI